MKRPIVRRADIADIGDIYALEQRCFSAPWPLEALYEDICISGHIYYVIIVQDKIIGYAGFWMILDEAHVNKICILPEYRQRGYGKRLLETIIVAAFELGADSMTLEVRASNFPAIHLYQAFDFEIEGVRKGYYQDSKEDAFIMWKQGIRREMIQMGLG